MKDTKVLSGTAYSFEGKMPLRQAIPLGLQHVLAMFVGEPDTTADHHRGLRPGCWQ